ncbi:primosomal protein N' [Candidatus Peregrinibacteria bacterium]|nr:primosomal protein N' [Candidatus Peregrinibacteria bacterium]
MRYLVLPSSRSSGIGNGLTYEANDVKVGSAVRVPLRNKLVEGIVFDVIQERASVEYDVKQVKEILGDAPLLTDVQLRLVRWVAEEYCCSLRAALSVFLPPPPWSALLPADITGYALKGSIPEHLRSKKQMHVLEYLQGKDWVSIDNLKGGTGVTKPVLDALLKQDLIEKSLQKESSTETKNQKPKTNQPILTEAQKSAYESMRADPRPSLLFGITGSGKTEVYAQLIADTIEAGKQAILLVPEILLTEHSIHRFRNLIDPEYIAIVHSRLTPSQRRETWKKIHRGEISLVIGSRSALFSPLSKLGLVILDEEHEWTYKNEQTPRYHARETADALCRFTGAKLVLGTATPSLESWARAKAGRYHLARLPERYKNQPLPAVRVIDLAEARFGAMYPFSPPLLTAIEERLKKGEQSVLFLNHRGTATSLLCLQCRRRIVSPESQLPFTVHEGRDGKPFLLDHISGVSAPVPSECPSCHSTNLLAVGAGTQKVEALLRKQFPTARLLRADSDTLEHPEQMRLLLEKMRDGRADILLGTQSVVKGLDLPNVTLAAVLVADIGLSLPHFRAGERIFQLLTQLTGRSGRAKLGEVIIQTFRPNAPEILAAAKHKTEPYLEQELKLRLYTGYPPATRMIRLIFRGSDAKLRAEKLHIAVLQTIARQSLTAKASVAPTLFGAGKVWHVLLSCEEPRKIITQLDLTDVVIDVDPIECV